MEQVCMIEPVSFWTTSKEALHFIGELAQSLERCPTRRDLTKKDALTYQIAWGKMELISEFNSDAGVLTAEENY